MRQNILFVDDEPDFLEGIQRLIRIRRSDWVVHTAPNPEQAWEQLDQGAIDVIVLDVTMPNGGGFGLLEQVKDKLQTRDIPVIILTGMRDNALKRRALELGATDLLNKPVVWEDLEARLQSALCLKRYQDELKNQAYKLEQNVRQRTRELETSRLEIILRLGKASEYRDEETGSHVLRMGFYCRLLARELHLSEEFCEMVFVTSPLHDIGKIGIPDRILLKPDSLNPAELMVMQQHCQIGSEILQQQPRGIGKVVAQLAREQLDWQEMPPENPILRMASIIALTHHERWDGSGYPSGLCEQDIPLASRLVVVADVYDALRSVRPYKPAIDKEETVRIMQKQNGIAFDPKVFEVFEAHVDRFHDIYSEFQEEADNCPWANWHPTGKAVTSVQ